jgi:hypothetical protein
MVLGPIFRLALGQTLALFWWWHRLTLKPLVRRRLRIPRDSFDRTMSDSECAQLGRTAVIRPAS